MSFAMGTHKRRSQGFYGTGQDVKRNMVRGAITVEFALLLVPMILLGFGVAEYARALYQYNTLVKTVRASARLLSHYNPGDATAYSLVLDEARCLTAHGNTSCAGASLVPGLTTGMVDIVSVTTPRAAGSPITLVEVRITGYAFEFVFNPVRLMGNAANTIPFGDIHATMRQL